MFMSNTEEVKGASLIEEYKQLVITNWNKSRESIIEVGKILITAKDKCNNGELDTKSWNKTVSKDLPFSKRTADRLIKIAECEWITSGDYDNSLPVSWGTLYEISTLTKTAFEKGVESDSITSNCSRDEILRYKDSLNDIVIPDALTTGAESSGAVTMQVESDKRTMEIGRILINEKSFNASTIMQLQKNIEEVVSKLTQDARVDFESYNKKVEEKEEKVREKNEVEIVKESYTKLKDATMDMVQNNPILSDKYLMTPESKEKMRKEFFLEKSLSFLATKYIKQFGVDSFDGVVKNTKLSKDYITSIRDCVVVAA